MKKHLGIFLLAGFAAASAGQTPEAPSPRLLFPGYMTNWPGAFAKVEAAPVESGAKPSADREPSELLAKAVNLLRRGDASNAVVFARAAAQRTGAHRPNAVMLLAHAHEAAGDWSAAADTWWRLDTMDADSVIPGLQAIRCQIQWGETDPLPSIFKYLNRNEEKEVIVHLAGAAYLRAGQRRQAWRFLAKAFLVKEPWPETAVMLSQVTALDGDLEESLGWLKKGLALTRSPAKQYEWLTLPVLAVLKPYPEFEALKEEAESKKATPTPPGDAPRRAFFLPVTGEKETLPEELDVRLEL